MVSFSLFAPYLRLLELVKNTNCLQTWNQLTWTMRIVKKTEFFSCYFLLFKYYLNDQDIGLWLVWIYITAKLKLDKPGDIPFCCVKLASTERVSVGWLSTSPSDNSVLSSNLKVKNVPGYVFLEWKTNYYDSDNWLETRDFHDNLLASIPLTI